MRKQNCQWLAVVAWLVFAGITAPVFAAEIDETKLPPPAATQIDFDRDIKPIFEKSCFRCHGPEKPKSGFRLDKRELALKGGEHGDDILPGQSAKSPLIHFVARLVEDMEMPPEGKGDPLTSEQIGLLRAWIDQGAKWSEAPAAPETKIRFSATPSIRWVTVSGDKARFREHSWMQDEWSGGVQDFRFEERLGEGEKLTAEGRTLFGGHDYQLKLALEKQDFGFARFGFEQYRRYYDDTGGYYQPFATNSFNLDRDLFVDIGRAWVEFGLTLPKWPRMVLGYEYQFKDGSKSTLQWSDVTSDRRDPASARAIYPSAKGIDEHAHVLKLDVSHELGGVLLEDNFRAEFYDLATDRDNRFSFSLGAAVPDRGVRYDESHDYFQAVNTFRMEKQLRDWLFVSGGYLFSKLDGDAAFSLAGFIPSDPSVILFEGDTSNQILLERRSHVFNVNSLLGPWQGLSFFAGVQNEWTREEGLGTAVDPDFTKTFSSDRDKVLVEESFGLRYTKIPFTVLYADTRFRQEGIDHFEQQFIDDEFGDDRDFLRDTDASSDLKDYRTGLSVSPWRRTSFQASYRHRIQQNDFDHKSDFDASDLSGSGYPAFIRARDIESDEVEAKAVVHWAPWLKTTFKYQILATDYTTVTDPSRTTVFDPIVEEIDLPGGSILAGDYDAHIYSVNATFIPWRRLFLSSTFSYSDSRITTGVNNGTSVVPYGGDVFSVVSSANFALNSTTDWQASYAFSRADYSQNNASVAWPQGIAYDHHSLVAGVSRRFKNHMTTNLQYGFFRYDEPSSGRVNNYTAHAVLASLTISLQ
jgi:mono/diheme cytochrome c family protein